MREVEKVVVSVIIVNYESDYETLDCIASIYKSKPTAVFEIIVVDNSQSSKLKKDLKRIYPKVNYIKSPCNLGYGAGNNLGIFKSKGKYIFVLNPDTIVRRNAIEELVNFLDENPDVACVGPNLIDRGGKYFDLMGTEKLTPLTAIFSLTFINKLFPNNKIARKYWLKNISKRKIRDVGSIPGSAFMIRRDAFLEIGGFDEKMFMFFEEHDLGLRLKNKGFRMVMYPKAEVVHHWTSSKNSKNLKNIYNESRYYYFNKHFGILPSLCVEIFTRASKWNLFIMLLFLFTLAIYLFKVPEYTVIFNDAGWFYLEAKKMLTENYFPLVSIPSSVPVLRQGAIWTWLLYLALKIGNGNPIFGAYLSSIIGIASMVITYYLTKEFLGKYISSIALIIASTSPLIIFSLRIPYHTAPIYLFSMIFFWAFLRSLKKKDIRYYFLTGFAFSLLFQFELAAFVLLPIFSFIYFKQRSKLNIKLLLAIFAGAFWGAMPFVIYDLNNGVFIQTIGFLIWFVTKIFEAVIGIFQSIQPEMDLSSFYYFIQNTVYADYLPLAMVIIFLALANSVIFRYLGSNKEKVFLESVLAWLILGTFGFIARGTFSGAYMPILFYPMVILTALLFWRIIRIHKLLGVVVFTGFAIINLNHLLSSQYYSKDNQQKYQEMLRVSNYIINDSSGNKYDIAYLGPGMQFESGGSQFKYILWWLGNEASKDSQITYTIVTDQFTNNYTGSFEDLGSYNIGKN